MVGKTITGLFNFVISSIKKTLFFIINIPNCCKNKIIDCKRYISNYKYRLTHIGESNFELGVYHLECFNISDAIFRFKLLDRFFKKGDSKVLYFLGLAYYFKSDLKKSLEYLGKSKIQEAHQLEHFIKNIDKTQEIPSDLWTLYRNYSITKVDELNPIFNDESLISILKKILENIKTFPDNYKIFEIGPSVGFVGEEIKRRFPDTATLIGAEYSDKIYKLLLEKNPNYDQALLIQDYKFLNNLQEQFYLIVSFCGISYTQNLNAIFKDIKKALSSKGYFVFCARASDISGFDLDKKEFVYNQSDVLNALEATGFNILYKDKISVEKNEKYLIFICDLKI